MPMAEPPENLAPYSLTEIVRMVEHAKLPPVDLWTPTRIGESGMQIARDGTWYHEGSPISRPNMVRLFSGILRREPDGRHALVTPVEKLFIAVDDAPFLAVECKSDGEGPQRVLVFRLNTGDLVRAGPQNGLRVADDQGEPAPYLVVRGGMEARLTRPVYYELAEIAIEEGQDPPGVWSDGQFFSLVPS
jgi:uncharacterized protein